MSVEETQDQGVANIIIREGVFSPSKQDDSLFLSMDDLPDVAAVSGLHVDLASDQAAEDLVPYFNTISLIRVAFPNLTDGRGFSLGQRLRALG